MPMSGVRLQLLPLHGALSTRSLAPAASTAVLFASMASAGSLEPLGRYGVAGLPTVTLLSADRPDCARASVGTARAAVTASNATKMAERRIIAGYLPMLSCVVFCEDLGSITPASGKSPGPGDVHTVGGCGSERIAMAWLCRCSGPDRHAAGKTADRGQLASPITSHMKPAPAMVQASVRRLGWLACASGRMSEVAR